MRSRELEASDIDDLMDIVKRTGVFTDEEVIVARDVLEEAVLGPDQTNYRSLVALLDERVVGYILWGRTPMTRQAYDLYWMAVDPDMHGRGIGRSLVESMEALINAEGGGIVRVETSGLPEYAATRVFYERTGYAEHNRIDDFYWPGNALCTHVKVLVP
jgi:GNAT superfamily N-acetyltransferase